MDKHKQIWILYKRRSAQLLECVFTVHRGARYPRVMMMRVSFNINIWSDKFLILKYAIILE